MRKKRYSTYYSIAETPGDLYCVAKIKVVTCGTFVSQLSNGPARDFEIALNRGSLRTNEVRGFVIHVGVLITGGVMSGYCQIMRVLRVVSDSKMVGLMTVVWLVVTCTERPVMLSTIFPCFTRPERRIDVENLFLKWGLLVSHL